MNPAPEHTITPAGLHAGRCISVIDLGAHRFNGAGQQKAVRRVWLSFAVWCPGEDRARFVGREFSLSMGPRSHLRKFLEGWRGLPFATDRAAWDFDLRNLLDKPVHLQVMHQRGAAGVTYANVGLASTLPPALRVDLPESPVPLRHFTFDAPQRATFQKLPPFLQTKIRSSETWSLLTTK